MVKFGQFKLKSGILSPIYIDLRILVSYPKILAEVSAQIYNVALKERVKPFDLVCGVPYTALPMATVLAVHHNIPMVVVRKETKDYGTKQQIEGKFSPGQNCLVIEDIVTSGGSVIGVAQLLKKAGLDVTDLAVFLDREQGGKDNIQNQGYKLHYVVKISEVLLILRSHQRITEEKYNEALTFIRSTSLMEQPKTTPTLTYSQRADLSANPVAKRLLKLMDKKKSNLCLALDVTSKKQLLYLADLLGPEICILKVHIDIIQDFDQDLITQLLALSKKHEFLIFEDRKFADIGNTVKSQYSGGLYKISEWADITNSHIVSGAPSIAALRDVGLAKGRGLLLIGQMSSADAKNDTMEASAIDIAKKYPDFVIGFISQEKLIKDDNRFIYCTPGVSLDKKGDKTGQQYNTPQLVIEKKGSDVIIVGRGITDASNPLSVAREYRKEGWNAYINSKPKL